MTNPMQFDPDRLRVALDNGEVVDRIFGHRGSAAP